jgi:hypothetical protein
MALLVDNIVSVHFSPLFSEKLLAMIRGRGGCAMGSRIGHVEEAEPPFAILGLPTRLNLPAREEELSMGSLIGRNTSDEDVESKNDETSDSSISKVDTSVCTDQSGNGLYFC